MLRATPRAVLFRRNTHRMADQLSRPELARAISKPPSSDMYSQGMIQCVGLPQPASASFERFLPDSSNMTAMFVVAP